MYADSAGKAAKKISKTSSYNSKCTYTNTQSTIRAQDFFFNKLKKLRQRKCKRKGDRYLKTYIYFLIFFHKSGLGYAALTLSVMHTLVFGWNFAFSSQAYAFYMPPSYMLAVALPCVVLVCRCFLLLPCVSTRLARIRRGWESTRKCPVSQHHRVRANRTVLQV